MQKLFLSMTRTVRGIAEGTVTDLDLAIGLFHFVHLRPSVAAPLSTDPRWTAVVRDLVASVPGDAERRGIEERFTVAVEIAEEHGRIIWPKPGARLRYSTLNALLCSNGHPAIDESGPFSRADIARRIGEAGVPVTVID